MPDRGSGEHRLFSLLKILASSHQVTLYTWSWGQEVSDAAKLRYRENLIGEGIIHESNGLRALLQRAQYNAIIFEWYYWVDWYLENVKTWQPDTKIIIDTVDIEFRRLALQAQAASGYNEKQLRDFKRKELSAYKKADMLIAVSDEEMAILAEELPGKEIGVIPNIHVFPETLPSLSAEPNVIFVGNFRFNPNLDAVQYFCSEIWPDVRAKIPAAKFRVVGNALPSELPLFRSAGIEPVGYVLDTAIWLAQSRVSVAPLRFGAGVKGKVSEAVASGIPVVTTSVGVQGMPLAPGKEILVGDSPRDFSDAVVALLKDFDACEIQRERAWQRLRTEFGVAAVRDKVDEILARVSRLRSNRLPLWRRWMRRARGTVDRHLSWRFAQSSQELDILDKAKEAGVTAKRQSPG